VKSRRWRQTRLCFGIRISSFVIPLMDILPVLDVLNGVVVRGVAGKREEYRPVVSRLADSPDVLSVASAFRDQLGLTRVYLADLDAILYQRQNRNLYAALAEDGFELLVDAGLRNVESAESVLAAGATRAIAGLETWSRPDELAQLCRTVGSDRVTFSLDLKQSRPLGDVSAWRTADPLTIARRAIEAGIEEVIVLDLAQVGMGHGVTTTTVCQQLLDGYPGVRVLTGGGVRDPRDLESLAAAGISGVLVASAFHDGRLTRKDIARYSPTGNPA
jgi:phosphoribosylformimino-5-aminoimidazole carboxamide ribotide isomerase